MFPTITSDRVTGDVNLTAGVSLGDDRQPAQDKCALCSLPRSQHGVQFIHRFIDPGRPIATFRADAC